MSRRKISGLRTIVTGASSGIGRELALELARQGARSVLTARRREVLEGLQGQVRELGGEAHLVAGDIAEAELRQRLLEAAQAELGGLDLLINNAGVGAIGPFAEASEARLRRVMEVNFFAPAELIRCAVPLLQAGNRPMIVNVSSVLGHRGIPKKSEYCASKFALHGLSDSIRAELTARGIDVLLVSPGTTATDFFDNVLEKNGDLPWLAFGAMSARSVARRTVKAIRRGRHEIILTPGGKALVWCDRLCPPLVNRLVARFG
ncbi:MAG: SDR family NAD(P)-dependent oxidoreductase [Candidatus Anammoximicrobium sp.]|nr:SDR family NAD(P)-dependent oxidoreductase [Candidatus Anammoximicrobium sp.]